MSKGMHKIRVFCINMMFYSFIVSIFFFFSFYLSVCSHFFQVDNLDWKSNIIMTISTILVVFFFSFFGKNCLALFFCDKNPNPPKLYFLRFTMPTYLYMQLFMFGCLFAYMKVKISRTCFWNLCHCKLLASLIFFWVHLALRTFAANAICHP